MRRYVPTLFTAVFAAALATMVAPPARAQAPGAPFHPQDFDLACAPCRDFDQYANGGWRQHTKLPPGYSSYTAFEEVYDRNEAVLRGILEKTAADRTTKAGTDRARLATYFSTCMDSAGAEAAGAKPVAGLLADVESMASTGELARRTAWLHAHGIGALFGFFANQDPKNSDEVIAFAGQGGLGLPDRDYYLRTDSASVATRATYVRVGAKLLELAGEGAADAQRHAEAALALETELAKASMTNVQRRDPKATYHKLPADSLLALSPSFAWGQYFAGRKTTPAVVNVQQPDFFRALEAQVASAPLETWKAYLRLRILRDAAPTLSGPFVAQWFEMRKTLAGVTELLPRWKRCITETDDGLGEILGKEYLKVAFTPDDKARMLAMVKNLEAALGERIEAADWMGDSTRAQAATKLAAFTEKIGYPDQWRDYSSVSVRPGAYYANKLEARAFESARNIAKIGKPVERGEWSMTPPTVNAYYSSSLNSINFPAGILQPPFFDSKADDATNYGAIGAVIGHEMSHGFDDRGRQFDPKGNLRDWWTAADVERYKARADQVAAQFGGYTVIDTLHVNGRLTLGENIADLGGMATAYAAMQKAYAGRRDVVGGFSPEQRFFLGWARVWHDLSTDSELRTQVQTDSHSPSHWRINGPMSNLKEFRDAWGCKDGDAMVRPAESLVRIW
jgi:predicted metalloendopeptidase